MKKIIATLMSGLMFLCLSMGSHAQSSEQELDQGELMKQFIGVWKLDLGNDTIVLWELIPFHEGYESIFTWKTKGEAFATSKGILGFTWQKKLVNQYILWQNGMIARDLGKFVSENKLVMERFNAEHNHTFSKWELEFVTPDKFLVKMKSKGVAQTWDNATEFEWTYIRVD